MLTRVAVAVVASALFAAIVTAHAPPTSSAGSGVVFSMSNGATKNKVLTWSRAANGALSFIVNTATGGRGTGGTISNQGGLASSGAPVVVSDTVQTTETAACWTCKTCADVAKLHRPEG